MPSFNVIQNWERIIINTEYSKIVHSEARDEAISKKYKSKAKNF